MEYKFNDILDDDMYNNAKVAFVLGKYSVFNNIVCDRFRETCIDRSFELSASNTIAAEFGISGDDASEDSVPNSVDFNTFMDVIGVASIAGKWHCKVMLGELNAKQKERLMRYIKDPSEYGLLVVESTDWLEYKDILRNKSLKYSNKCHIIQLSFPNRTVLKSIVKELFNKHGKTIADDAAELFISKMSRSYEEYNDVINEICNEHEYKVVDLQDIRTLMKGIQHYIIDDFVRELTVPLSSGRTNNKKVLRIMMYLEDEFGAKSLVYSLLRIIDECIEFRTLINSGVIPIGINYFYKDIISELERMSKEAGEEKCKYSNMNEWSFRKKAELASKTSMRDWVYMGMILRRALSDVKISDREMDAKCQRALYELCTRSVLSNSRIDNIIGVDNVLERSEHMLDNIVYDEDKLKQIKQKELVEA